MKCFFVNAESTIDIFTQMQDPSIIYLSLNECALMQLKHMINKAEKGGGAVEPPLSFYRKHCGKKVTTQNTKPSRRSDRQKDEAFVGKTRQPL